MYLNLVKKIEICQHDNWLDLETLGYRLIMSENLPKD